MMKNKLVELRASLTDLKEASMFKKAEAAEASLMAALALLENMVAEIEKLKAAEAKRPAPAKATATAKAPIKTQAQVKAKAPAKAKAAVNSKVSK